MPSDTPSEEGKTEDTPPPTARGANANEQQQDTSNDEGRRNNRNNNREHRDNENRNNSISGTSKDFEGGKPELKAVLALAGEQVTLKKTFDAFRETLSEHIVREYNNGSNVVSVIKYMEDPMVAFKNDEPTDLTEEQKKSTTKVRMHNRLVDKYVDRQIDLEENLKRIYILIWGQCTHTLKTYVQSMENYDAKSKAYDVLWLLKQLKPSVSGIDTKADKFKTLWLVLKKVVNMKQGQNEDCDDFYSRVKSNFEQLTLAGGEHVFDCSAFLAADIKNPTKQEKEKSIERFQSMGMLQCIDKTRFGKLLTNLDESMHVGRNEYPKTLANTYDLLVKTSGVVNQQTPRLSHATLDVVAVVEEEMTDGLELLLCKVVDAVETATRHRSQAMMVSHTKESLVTIVTRWDTTVVIALYLHVIVQEEMASVLYKYTPVSIKQETLSHVLGSYSIHALLRVLFVMKH